MAVKVSLDTLRSAISRAEDKADSARQTDRDQRILDSQIAAANQRIESAEGGVTRAEMTKKEAQDKLSPPPTKQVTSDGKKGGTKTVVDEREKDKLQAQVRAADVQIQQAQSAVEDARAEAERLSAQALSGAGVSDEQQAAMGELSDLVAELKQVAEGGEESELRSDDFQTKLEDAIKQSEELADNLPDEANAVLNGFWEEIEEGFQAVDDRFTQITTPDDYVITRDQYEQNYPEFFEDFNAGMNQIISTLEGLPTDHPSYKNAAIIRQIGTAQNNVMQQQDKFLRGVVDNEDQLVDVMNTINQVIIDLDPESGKTLDDSLVTQLINGTNSLASTLERGGDSLGLFLASEFDVISRNAGTIGNSLPEGDLKDQFTELQTKLSGIDNPNSYQGFKLIDYIGHPEGLDLTSIATRIEDMATAFTSSTPPSDQDILDLINDTNQLADRFTTDYSPASNNTGSDGSGGSPGGGVVGGDRVYRRTGASSRFATRARR